MSSIAGEDPVRMVGSAPGERERERERELSEERDEDADAGLLEDDGGGDEGYGERCEAD
jgi:hypothetical protein